MNNYKNYLFFIIFIFCYCINCYAQNRNNIWYFGTKVGLDFNINPPVVLNNADVHSFEACATICDNNGNLLFYTNGDSVWNKNRVGMSNGFGLLGGTSSTQGALIIPKPCDNNIYYIFNVTETESFPYNFYYSIVDITQDAGLGAVTVKNVMVHEYVTEKLTATLKGNGNDYWIAIYERMTGNILVYGLTASGLDLNPVIYNGGGVSIDDRGGYMRFSHDGTKLCAVSDLDTLKIFDFDKTTGIISNRMDIMVDNNPYGLELSPDNSKLYTASITSENVYQYNLLAGSQAAIQNSKTVLASGAGVSFGALKLGPDNKIYVAQEGSYISVIDQPNQPGIACNFLNNSIYLGSPFSGYLCQLGLPNNLDHFSTCNVCPTVASATMNVTICSNQTYQLPSGTIINTSGTYQDTIRNMASCDSIITTVNLYVSPVSNVNTAMQICSGQTYQLPSGTIVSAAGIYIDTLRSVIGCDSLITTVTLSVFPVSYVNTAVQVCSGQTYTLPSGTIVNAAGVYIDTLRSVASCDSVIITTNLSVLTTSFVNTSVQVCSNQTYTLPSGTIVNAAGVYIDTLRSVVGCDSIITTTILSVFPVNFLNTEAHICSNETYSLPSGTIVNTEGIFIDTLRSVSSCDSIINTIHLFVNDVSATNIFDSIFAGQTYTLPSGETVSTAGIYQSILLNSVGCDSVITTTLKLKEQIAECITLKNAFTPNGDGINDFWVLYRYICFKRLEVNVYNRYGSLVYHSNDYKNDWNGKYKNKELPDGTYYYIIKVISFDGREHVFKDNVTILR